ncbi:MAG: hypothetical protein ACR2LY_04095 [Thermoleophilaceae bacterium]
MVRLLEGVRSTPSFPSFFESLAVAGRGGTPRRRTAGGATHRNRQGKNKTTAKVLSFLPFVCVFPPPPHPGPQGSSGGSPRRGCPTACW